MIRRREAMALVGCTLVGLAMWATVWLVFGGFGGNH